MEPFLFENVGQILKCHRGGGGGEGGVSKLQTKSEVLCFFKNQSFSLSGGGAGEGDNGYDDEEERGNRRTRRRT